VREYNLISSVGKSPCTGKNQTLRIYNQFYSNV